ncbi:hypothetical protein QZH41_003380 [Actinostola sp. cb2023]|nr:hypothetical protein QZH41_003380 [Actinostola sp. cb2023]
MPEANNEAAEDVPPEKESPKKVPRNRILCRVTCLDKNFLTAELPLYIFKKLIPQKDAKGLDLMRRVCDQLNVQEREYFGLLFNHKKEKYWLEPRKVIKSQLKGSKPEFQLSVKFYEPYPTKLKSDYTRYMLCLQVRDDINCERLPCSFGSQALLGSYIVQGELGDYDPREHRGNYLEGMVFGPTQTEELVEKVKDLHKVNKGLTPAQCDMQYLEAARKLSMFGVDAHPALDMAGAHKYIVKFSCQQSSSSFPPTKSWVWRILRLIKSIFNMVAAGVVESMGRLSFPDPPPSKTATLLKKGSKFRYSDRTLYQLRKEGFPVSQDAPQFMRVSSRNWSERYEPATTEIIVVADEERKKRPYDKDKRHDGPQDKRPKGGDRVAPLSQEEMMATMTMEERDEYKRKMAERMGAVTTTTTTTTTVYYPGQEGQEGEGEPIKAEGAGVVESGQVAYGEREEPSHVQIIALRAEEEREKKRQEEEEKERKRREEEDREREREWQREQEKEEERERDRERRRRELERLAAADRADIAARKPPTETLLFKTTNVTPKKDEAEILEFSFATPVSSGDTIKRAKMKTAETDSYKGRVVRVQDNGYPEVEHKPAPGTKPKPKRDEPYARGHSTLPPRTQPVHTFEDDDDDDDRRKSADDMIGDKRRGPVQLISKEELIRCYSPAGSSEVKPEPKRPSQKERESDQVVKNIKRYSYEKDLDEYPPTEVKTETVFIGGGGDTQVYHQRHPPEVKTQSYTISSVGGPVKKPVSEDVQVTQTREVQSAPGGTTDSSRVTYTTSTREQRVERTVSEKMSLVDEDGNIIETGDPDTDRAIAEAIRQAKEADPNVKVTEVVITRGDETIA